MNVHFKRLLEIANKDERIILGLMSGTSLDGLDLALCSFSGSGLQTKVKVLQFETISYDEEFRQQIREVFAKREVDMLKLTLLIVVIAEKHASIINACLANWKVDPKTVDAIASHGQTVYHAPRVWHGLPDSPNATLQIGDGDHIARKTGIVTLSDFRQKHLAAGGEGAPLALYGDYFLFSRSGVDRILLNIGGISNFTFLPASGDPNHAFATDIGPGNTLIDAFARELFNVPFDENAMLATAGGVDIRLLQILKDEPFFEKPFPKSTGPEMFSVAWVRAAMAMLPKGNPNPYDVMATLTQLTAETIVDAVHKLPSAGLKKQLFLSGGGSHNPMTVRILKEKLPEISIAPMQDLGIHGDAKEAVLFALLANETLAGEYGPSEWLGGIPLVGMGKISLPD